ncbi:MAG: NAD(P)/FAD-dependent oxidoreductase [Sediminimonas qiaohouensis]|uniref:NAD(P)/FAD-dependent oxidoreductase n=1 Tax=Sediminimonas qiaohouensis TaxID=552061 RepID=A0A7C9L752_9RHOB|nr:NAD(P)/FAD-dependent oxidoreductase [Sediminimonas qiaohouensis]MTJ03414.1 NAD(P)/FAD-dependent oxidoreductase [Sediminimonas qiaohouensis]
MSDASYDTLILGAGAAGLMCAAHAGGQALVIDHAKAPGEKIRISGGGRCNFTNMYTAPENFLGGNPHFHKSALSRYTQWDFIALMDSHGISWHEKTLGQLFCDGSARQVVAMLMQEARTAGAEVALQTRLVDLDKNDNGFAAVIETEGRQNRVHARSVVVATGGKSIPAMGASGMAYDIARQFGHDTTDTRAALVPLTFPDGRFKPLAGVSLPVRSGAGGVSFDEAMLFTHRGLSGPAILQISSYWREGEAITLDLLPGQDAFTVLREARQSAGRRNLSTVLAQLLPSRLAAWMTEELDLRGNLADQGDAALRELAARLQHWQLTPAGTEGYRTAEVTLGGVETGALSSKTMESRHVGGLYFIGEAVDVTGWLGGYNFQWAWSSGAAAGRAISAARRGGP